MRRTNVGESACIPRLSTALTVRVLPKVASFYASSDSTNTVKFHDKALGVYITKGQKPGIYFGMAVISGPGVLQESDNCVQHISAAAR